ncbi:hypothetical protein ABFS83_14G136500 [Erythranthe nasuta]
MAAERVAGYEYNYCISVDNGIVLRYKYKLHRGMKTLMFEIQTNFIIKTTDGQDQIMDSETLECDYGGIGKDSESSLLRLMLTHRMLDYWMTGYETQTFELELLDFARQAMADPEHDASRRIIPVLVNFEVRTVRQKDETVGAAMDRAIRAEKLVQLRLNDRDRIPRDILMLSKTRVVNVDQGLGLMPVCRICTRGPNIGDQISVVPACGHAFHTHCFVQWMKYNNFCHWCDAPAFDDIIDWRYKDIGKKDRRSRYRKIFEGVGKY